MKIDFPSIPETVLPKFYNGEGDTIARIFRDEKVRIMRGRLPAGAFIGLHNHETNCEIIYIVGGRGKVLYEGKYEPLSVGSCHYCPKGCAHSLINDSDGELEFFAVVPEQ